MNKAFIKIITFVIMIFNCTLAFAVNSEFKNTLTNVDLIKTSENSYTVNLYTSKKYTSPVKVIKKNDLSYYILLPETKNIAPNINVQSSDIRSVDASLYSYAGVDVNNGYTKINISTTKPLNFSVVTKSATQKSVNSAKVASNASVKEEKVQKNILSSQKQETLKPASETNTLSAQKIAEKQPQTTANNDVKKGNSLISSNTKVNNPAINKAIQKEKAQKGKTQVKETRKKPVQQETSKYIETKLAKTPKKEIKNTASPKIKPQVMAAAKIKPEKTNSNEEEINTNKTEENLPLEEQDLSPIPEDEVASGEEATEVYDDIQPEKSDNKFAFKSIDFDKLFNKTSVFTKDIANNSKPALNRMTSNLSEYFENHSVTIIAIIAGILTFGLTLFLLLVVLPKFMPKEEQHSKLKNRADILKRDSTLVAKDDDELDASKAQYFVFEDNIKQTEFTPPSTAEEKKNYELVSYDPDLRTAPKIANENPQEDGDMDIIQKILKDDDFVDVPPIEKTENNNTMVKQEIKPEEKLEQKQETAVKAPVKEPVKQNENTTKPIGQERVQREPVKQSERQEENENEPKLLASYNISPEQGFMFISYNNNVSLMGFIYDDVFVLHDYKVPELSSYNLQYRLVDKDDKTSAYIVKTEAVKLLVKTSRTSMHTEIQL